MDVCAGMSTRKSEITDEFLEISMFHGLVGKDNGLTNKKSALYVSNFAKESWLRDNSMLLIIKKNNCKLF